MNKMKRILVGAADHLELPADILAGIPKIELTGFHEFSIEEHKGLLEYEKEQIGIETCLGKVFVFGKGLSIKLMNRHRLTVKGDLMSVQLGESRGE